MTSDKTDYGNKAYLKPTNVGRHVCIFIYIYALNNRPSFHYKDQAFNSTVRLQNLRKIICKLRGQNASSIFNFDDTYSNHCALNDWNH